MSALIQKDDPGGTAASTTESTEEVAPSLPPSDGTWVEAWRLDPPGDQTSRRNHDAPTVMANGTVMIFQAPGQHSSSVEGYDITSTTPSQKWTIRNPGSQPLALTDEAVIFIDSIVDASTGAVAPAPWEDQRPELIMRDLIITCTAGTATCSAWDLEGTSASLRWTQDLTGTRTPGFHEEAIAGGTVSGYAKITLSEKSHGLPMVAFVSLADGSVHNKQGQTDDKGASEPITPAADGWLRSSNDGRAVTPLTMDGARSDVPSWTASHHYSVLRSHSGAPTVEQYRRAWEAGDTSWAAASLTCLFSPGINGVSCTLDGRSLTVPTGTKSIALGGMAMREGIAERFMNDRWIAMGYQDPSILAEVRIIDRQGHRVVAGPPALYGEDPKAVVARPDLLIAVEDGSLIAYAPH